MAEPFCFLIFDFLAIKAFFYSKLLCSTNGAGLHIKIQKKHKFWGFFHCFCRQNQYNAADRAGFNSHPLFPPRYPVLSFYAQKGKANHGFTLIPMAQVYADLVPLKGTKITKGKWDVKNFGVFMSSWLKFAAPSKSCVVSQERSTLGGIKARVKSAALPSSRQL